VTGGEGALETTDPTEGSVYDAVVSFDAAEPVEQAREEAIASVVFALRGTQADFCTRFSLAQSLIEGYELVSSPDSATPCAALPAALDACSGAAPVDSAAAACCLGARLRGVLESADALVPLPCTP
jgi:xanthine dehydrogenase iron-sulfur cluster and FAD-binding subunit A